MALDNNGSNPEAMDALSEMYSLLKEEDMWAGLWQKKAEYQETNIAIAYEQQVSRMSVLSARRRL